MRTGRTGSATLLLSFPPLGHPQSDWLRLNHGAGLRNDVARVACKHYSNDAGVLVFGAAA